MKKLKKIALLLVGTLAIGGVLLLAQYFLAGGRGREAEVSFPGRGLNLKAELSLTVEQHRQGLMRRKELPRDRAMLFVFQEDERLAFWMKDTLIPLDLVFVSSDFRIVDIKKDFQPCDKEVCPSYEAVAAARYVVEMSAGLAAEKGLQAGDAVLIKLK
jgi:uncharacterized protein